MAFLAAEALHFRHRHALDAEFGQGFLYFLEFERLDDRFEFFHVKLGGGVWVFFNRKKRWCAEFRNDCAR